MSDSNEMSSDTSPSITCRKATNWIITLNNPNQLDVDAWTNVKQNHFVKEANGQLEAGENGTPHIQGYIRTDSVRFAQIKKLFPRAHIEIAKNVIAAKQYCQKQETRLQDLPVNEINTSIHRAVYEVTLEWYQDNWTDGQVVYRRPEKRSKQEVVASMLLDSHLLDDETKEYLYDKAVARLIRSGVKHIEFVAVNQITRSAFKKYFSSLIIREHNAQTQTQIQVTQASSSSS